MIMTVDAHANTYTADIDANHCGVRSVCTQQGQCKNRSNKDFHKGSLSEDCGPASPANIDVNRCRCYGKPRCLGSFQFVRIDTLFGLSGG
jgi:hypothetical protein